ncbi:MAG: glycosyltransferase family 39 protein, partial [Dehalococcoidia bacterium]|nr:glycosyltransferase family 39 protein [Dehalococcoidia bacterium]
AYLQSGGPLHGLALLRPPGYPALLGVALLPGWGVSGAMLVQLIASLAMIPLAYWLAKALGAGEPGALVGAVLIAVEPMNIGFAVSPMSEASAGVFLTAGMLLWVTSLNPIRWKRLLLAGVVFSLATLCRPTTLYFAPFALVGSALVMSGSARTKVFLGSLLAAGMLFLPGLWIARNSVVTGVPIMSTVEGTNMLEFRGAAIIARRDGVSFAEGRRRVVADFERNADSTGDAAHRSRQESAYGLSLIQRIPRCSPTQRSRGCSDLS